MIEKKKQIVLYTAFSPNGHKIAITLEELGLDYEMVHVNLPAIEHKEPWFLDINPNGRIPALTDTLEDGTPIKLFESGSIQQYLVDRYDADHKISYPRGTKEFYQTNNWVCASLAAPIVHAMPSDPRNNRSSSSRTRGLARCRARPTTSCDTTCRICLSNTPRTDTSTRPADCIARSTSTSKSRRPSIWSETSPPLPTLPYHPGPTFSVRVCFCKFLCSALASNTNRGSKTGFAGVEIEEFPHVQKWQRRMAQRPAVQNGYNTPKKVDLDRLSKDKQAFNTYLKVNEGWIRHGMEADAKK